MAKEQGPVFIEAKHTLSLVIAFLGISFVGFVLLGLTLLILLNWRVGDNYVEGIVTLNVLKDRLPLILLAGGIAQAIILSLILFLLSLLWAHSIAGPLVRFGKYLRLTGNNEPAPEEISFRKSDQLHALAVAFRHLQISRRRQNELLYGHLNKASRLLEEIDSSPSEAKSRIQELIKVYRDMKGIETNKG